MSAKPETISFQATKRTPKRIHFSFIKKPRTTTIEVSIEVYDKIHSVAEQIAKITHKKSISLNQALKIMFATQPLDQILQELMQDEEKWK